MIDPYKIAGEVEKRMIDIFGSSFVKIIIYGSYSKGNQDEESDLDIVVLVTENERDIEMKRAYVSDAASDISLASDVFVSVIVRNEAQFYERAEYVPFYMEVARNGIDLHG